MITSEQMEILEGIYEQSPLSSLTPEKACWEVSSDVADRLGWPQRGGYYDWGGPWGPEGHFWNEMPDGTIVDASHDQFDPDVPINVVAPGTPEHDRYQTDELHTMLVNLRTKEAISFDAEDWSCENATLDDGTVVHFISYGDAVPGGYNGGWLATVDGNEVGHIDYQSGGGEVGIGMVEVEPEWRRRGVASALLGRLRREFPGKEIDPGMTTPEGSAWWAKAAVEDYQTGHQPMDAEDGAPPLHDLVDGGTFYGPDVYEHPEWYSSRIEPYGRESARVVMQVRGKPDAMVTVYRAVPPDVPQRINTGDWVALAESYARTHAEGMGGWNEETQSSLVIWPILSAEVPARTIFNGGNDLQEWGYFGPSVQARKLAVKQANWMDDHAIIVGDGSGIVGGSGNWRELEPGGWLMANDYGVSIAYDRAAMGPEMAARFDAKWPGKKFAWQRQFYQSWDFKDREGTASSLEAAKQKATEAGQKEYDEHQAEDLARSRKLFGPTYGTPEYRAAARTASLKTDIEVLRPQLSAAVQQVVDEWAQDDEGFDEEFGYGGACDQAADAMASVLGDHGIETASGGAEGDDHAWVVALRGEEVVGVDIPPGVYETGGGYSWTKRQDVSISPNDVDVWDIDVPVENFREGMALPSTPGLYWRAHPQGRVFTVEDADSTAFSGFDRERKGYSCVTNPWYLLVYFVRMGWFDFGGGRSVRNESEIVAFTGTPQRTKGVDGEPLVVPDMGIVQRFGWPEFEEELLTTPVPEWWAPKGTKVHSWEEFCEEYVWRMWGHGGKPDKRIALMLLDRYAPEKAKMLREAEEWAANRAKAAAIDKTLDEAIEDLADTLLNAPSQPPTGGGIWGDRKPRVDPDWAKILGRVKTMYRGYGLRVTEEEYEFLFGDRYVYDRAEYLMGLMSKRGLGKHWTTNRNEAAGFAGMVADRGDVRVILWADPPRPEDVLVGEGTQGLGIQAWDDIYGEQEIPIRAGAPLHVKTIEWGKGGPRPMLRSDDGGGWECAASIDETRTAIVKRAAKTTVYRGISLQGFEPGGFAMGLDSSIMGRFQTLMRKGDHQGAAQLVLGLVGKSGGFVEGGGSGVWYSTDLTTAQGYSGMHMRWQSPATGRAGEGTLACVIHAEVDDEDIDVEGASRGYTHEYPVVLKPGAQVDVVAIDLRYNAKPMDMANESVWVHVPLSMEMTAAKEAMRPPVPVVNWRPGSDGHGGTGVVSTERGPIVAYRGFGSWGEPKDSLQRGEWISSGMFTTRGEGDTQMALDLNDVLQQSGKHRLRGTGFLGFIEADISGLPFETHRTIEANPIDETRGSFEPDTGLGIGIVGGIPLDRIRRVVAINEDGTWNEMTVQGLRNSIDQLKEREGWEAEVKYLPETHRIVIIWKKGDDRYHHATDNQNGARCGWQLGYSTETAYVRQGDLMNRPPRGRIKNLWFGEMIKALPRKPCDQCFLWARTQMVAKLGALESKMYHLTAKVDFRLDPNKHPQNNTTWGGDWPDPGIFVTTGWGVEHWCNGYGYWQPWVVEFDMGSVMSDERVRAYEGDEVFVPATVFDKIRITRVLPLDAHCREVYGALGWTESDTGTYFDTFEPIPEEIQAKDWYAMKGYRYPGDARQTDSTWQAAYAKRVRKYRSGRTNAIASLAKVRGPSIADIFASVKPSLQINVVTKNKSTFGGIGNYMAGGSDRRFDKMPGNLRNELKAMEREARDKAASPDTARVVENMGGMERIVLIGSGDGSTVGKTLLAEKTSWDEPWRAPGKPVAGDYNNWVEADSHFYNVWQYGTDDELMKTFVEYVAGGVYDDSQFAGLDPGVTLTIYRGISMKPGADVSTSVDSRGGVGRSWTLREETAMAIAERGQAGFSNANTLTNDVYLVQMRELTRSDTATIPTVVRAEVTLSEEGAAPYRPWSGKYLSEAEIDMPHGTEVVINGWRQAELVPVNPAEKRKAEDAWTLAEQLEGDEKYEDPRWMEGRSAGYYVHYVWGSWHNVTIKRTAMAVPLFKGTERNMSERNVIAAANRLLKDIAREYGYTGELPAVEITDNAYDLGSAAARSVDITDRNRDLWPHGCILLDRSLVERAQDKELGYTEFRIVAHEAIHALIQRDEPSYPGYSQMITEGGAEVLSVAYWAKNAPGFDDRDAVRINGKWVPGDIALVHGMNYKEWVAELMLRTASKVGWNLESILREVQRIVSGNTNVKLDFRDTSNPHFAPPSGVENTAEGLMLWLIGQITDRAPHSRFGALSLEAVISVAEQTMERAGLAGRTLHIPDGHADDPEYKKAMAPYIEMVSNWCGRPVSFYANDYILNTDGGGAQAMTDGWNHIVVRPTTTEMTILHEVAHVMLHEAESYGHTPEFVSTVEQLYRDHLGDAAADQFMLIVGDYV